MSTTTYNATYDIVNVTGKITTDRFCLKDKVATSCTNTTFGWIGVTAATNTTNVIRA